jgi:hypothetical protein
MDARFSSERGFGFLTQLKPAMETGLMRGRKTVPRQSVGGAGNRGIEPAEERPLVGIERRMHWDSTGAGELT